MATATKSDVRKPITAKQFEEAKKRYAANKAASKKIIDKSEEKIKKEMAARNLALGNMPQLMEQDAAIIQQYCEENRDALFGGVQSIDTEYGTLSFRIGKPTVCYPQDANEKEINKRLISAFKKRDLTLYIKTTETLDKNKIIADQNDKTLIKILEKEGVSVDQRETFSIDF